MSGCARPRRQACDLVTCRSVVDAASIIPPADSGKVRHGPSDEREHGQASDGGSVTCKNLHTMRKLTTMAVVSAQTLGFAVQPEDRPLLDELTAYFGNGNRSAYLRATLKVMKSIMIADQLRQAQAYGQQRTAELGIDPAEIPARIQEFLKSAGPG